MCDFYELKIVKYIIQSFFLSIFFEYVFTKAELSKKYLDADEKNEHYIFRLYAKKAASLLTKS